MLARLTDALFVALGVAAVVGIAVACFGVSPLWPAVVAAVLAVAFSWRRTPSVAEIANWLDERHGLSDLLGSAWGVRHRQGEPWAANLWSMANSTAATLPPPGRLAKFAGRHHACAWAGVAAIWLGSGLIAQPAASALAGSPTVSAAANDVQQVANVVPRAGDTASSETRLPSIESTHGQTSRQLADAGDDASGPGRANGGRQTELHAMASNGLATPQGNASGGSGIAANGSDHGASAGAVHVEYSNAIDRSTLPAMPDIRPPTAASAVRSPTTPAGYRDLVRDYFGR